MNIQKIVAKLPIGIQVKLNRHDYEYEGKCRVAGYMKGVTFKCRKCGESYFLANSKGVKETDVAIHMINTRGCKGGLHENN